MVEAEPGQTVKLNCTVNDDSRVNSLSWFLPWGDRRAVPRRGLDKGGRSSGQFYTRSVGNNTIQLLITKVDSNDAGSYECVLEGTEYRRIVRVYVKHVKSTLIIKYVLNWTHRYTSGKKKPVSDQLTDPFKPPDPKFFIPI